MFEQMTMNNNLTDHERWLAAEYALGVLGSDDMALAGKKFENERSFRLAVEGWQNQLSPMLDDVDEVQPPQALWSRIENQVAPEMRAQEKRSGGEGFWKLMTAFMSTAAVACFGFMMYVTGGDLTGTEMTSLKTELASIETRLQESESELGTAREEFASANEALAELRQATSVDQEALQAARAELANVTQNLEQALGDLEASQTQLAQVQDQINRSQPLVASLTQSGDAPAFVAQYDPLKKALLIRTTIDDTDEKVPEIWLIPEQGDRKGEVLSLGVMDEAAPDTVRITDEFLPLIGEGGTLAITMEPPGGAPNGVATGPVIALGKLQAL